MYVALATANRAAEEASHLYQLYAKRTNTSETFDLFIDVRSVLPSSTTDFLLSDPSLTCNPRQKASLSNVGRMGQSSAKVQPHEIVIQNVDLIVIQRNTLIPALTNCNRFTSLT